MQQLKEFENDNLDPSFRKSLFVIFFISVISFFVISFLVLKVSFSVKDYFYKKEVATLDKNFFLENKKSKEIKKLTSYGYVDEDEEFVHLPIDEAMDAVLKDYSK